MKHGIQIKTYSKGGFWWATLDGTEETTTGSDTRENAIAAWKALFGEAFGLDMESENYTVVLPFSTQD